MDSEFERLWGKGKPRTGDVFHTNSVNVFREMPDVQIRSFRPGEVLVSILKLNIIAVLDMDQERIVWAYKGSFKLQHDAQLLPNGHVLLFDNRGLGTRSRILELDVAGGEPAWEYPGADHESFYSETRGLVQRFDNGNTLITEGSDGRMLEVTPVHEIVWEYISPYRGKQMKMNMVYRAFRVPCSWVPQLDTPLEPPVKALEINRFRVPGSAAAGERRVVEMEGVRPYNPVNTACVLPGDR